MIIFFIIALLNFSDLQPIYLLLVLFYFQSQTCGIFGIIGITLIHSNFDFKTYISHGKKQSDYRCHLQRYFVDVASVLEIHNQKLQHLM